MLLVEQLLMSGPTGPTVIPPQRLFMWGSIDAYRQLGTDYFGNTNFWWLPKTNFSGGSGNLWTEVAASRSVAFAINSTGFGLGTLHVTGNNDNGQLGLGDYVNRSQFVQVGSLTNWSKVFASESRTMAIKTDGTLWVWGSGGSGVLGTNNNFALNSPVQVGTSSWTQVGLDQYLSLAIRSDGTLWVWGNNSEGYLGLNSVQVAVGYSSPVQIGSDSNWSKLSKHNAGIAFNSPDFIGSTSFAIKNDGSLYSWGYGFYGSLGINVGGAGSNRSSPTQVGTSSWTQITGSGGGILAIRSDFTLWAWGRNQYGQLGLGNTVDHSSPTQVGTSSWLQVAGCGFHVLARDNTGQLYAWGKNANGELGNLTFISRSSPIQVAGRIDEKLAPGVDFSLCRTTTSTLVAWGIDNVGQLGGGGNSDSRLRSSPVQAGSGTSYRSVTTGSTYTLTIQYNGTLWGWGNAYYLGTNDIPTTSILISAPVQIGTSSWSQVDAGERQVCAIRNGGSLFTWGFNYTGSLGTNDIIHRSSPTQIGTSSWSQVSSGLESPLAIRSDGALFAWGNNTTGALGLNDTVHRSSPVQVGTSSWSQIAANGSVAFAIRSDKKLFVWGNSIFGNHGLNDTTDINRSSPTQIGTSNWTKVACSRLHVLAIREDGALFAWGWDADGGALGLSSTAFARSSPTQVGTSSWSQVAASYHVSSLRLNSMAIRYDGTLWAWGRNSTGTLGNLSTISRSSPIQIGSLNTWTSISLPNGAGGGDSRDGFHAAALTS